MKERDLTKITFPSYGVKAGYYCKPKTKKEVIGWDSETYKGKITLLSNSLGEYIIPDSLNDVLSFIYKEKYQRAYNFFFNLEYDTNALIKLFPEKNIRNFISLNQSIWKEYKISLIPRKLLFIKKENAQSVKYYDIYQFYQLGTLENTYEKVFKKPYKKRISDRSKGFKKSEITPKVIKYCVEDSIACKELAENFVNLAHSFIYIPQFLSPASISKALIKSKLRKDYRFSPSKIQQFALSSYQGGRFECLRRGSFDKIYIYDINSAYPSEMSKLAEPIGAYLTNNSYEPESLYSYFKADIKLDIEEKISPMKYFFPKKNLLVYPIGEFKDIYLTKCEYELLKDYDAKIEIKKARHVFNDDPYYPYEWINDLYYKRLELKNNDDPLEFILKLALNSGYGISIQLNKKPFIKLKWEDKEEKDYHNEVLFLGDKTVLKSYKWVSGQFFNPIIATEITSRIRVKLIRDSLKDSDKVIMFATDSITTDKKINLPLSKKIGDYQIENKGFSYGVILGNGIYQIINDKKLSGSEIPERVEKKRFRGFSRTFNLINILKNNMRKKIIKLKKKRPYKLKESRTKLEKLNIFDYFEKKLNINSDQKRRWERDFINSNDVLHNQIDSYPLEVGKDYFNGEYNTLKSI